MPLLPGLTDVIGRPVTHDGIMFVPILGRFEFTQPKLYLNKHAHLDFLNTIMDEELYSNDSLWVRSRLIKIFGIDHPSGHAMTTLLNFQVVAFEWDTHAAMPKYLVPFIVADTWNGYVDDYGYSPDASIAFPKHVNGETQSRIAASFWSLLLKSPTKLGIYSDYWYCEYDGSLVEISCDGCRIAQDFVGFWHPEPRDEGAEDCYDDWWPFELQRKQKRRDRTQH